MTIKAGKATCFSAFCAPVSTAHGKSAVVAAESANLERQWSARNGSMTIGHAANYSAEQHGVETPCSASRMHLQQRETPPNESHVDEHHSRSRRLLPRRLAFSQRRVFQKACLLPKAPLPKTQNALAQMSVDHGPSSLMLERLRLRTSRNHLNDSRGKFPPQAAPNFLAD
jgi:hypothetical protein